MNEFIAKKMESKKPKKVVLEENFNKFSQKKPTPKIKEEPSATIYVGNLSYRRDEEGIKKMFSSFGFVSSVKILMREGTELKSGVAFVEMKSREKALRAVSYLDGKIVDERTLKVSIAHERFGKK